MKLGMNSIMQFENGYNAIISYDQDIDMFRGEFLDLNGGADFYSSDIKGLRQEGATSLRIFLEECQKYGIEPKMEKSESIDLILDHDLFKKAIDVAVYQGESLNYFIANAVQQAVR